MTTCQGCGTALAVEARFCSSCGAPASSSLSPTMTASAAAAAAPARTGSSVQGTFAPGAVLQERYRIVAPLGRGGMGEVYRADDLKLGHPVALKFLPPEAAATPGFIERFHAEVRNARQIAHPNVCRVYDIGEVQGQHFFTMEYIDGEDLASLLRRIGRLPADKALEIAHQLCSGLAAAHETGLLHRDLKPANVMLDGRGRARITDFGLAVSADEARDRSDFAGTPAYMAPEQRAGRPATVRSDVYSLGLVLFEIFTGRRAFEGDALAAWRGSDSSTRASSAGEVDPAVQRAILRCLNDDPALRPESAMRVAAALPGGDPLAAALAAGETPSPEMVAAAQSGEYAISVGGAVGLIFVVVVLMALVPFFVRRGSAIGIVPMSRTPDALVDESRKVIGELGYTRQPYDSGWWFYTADSYLRYRAGSENGRWFRELSSAWPPPHRFYYRQHDHALMPNNARLELSGDDPPPAPGNVSLVLDPDGQLLAFEAVPPAREPEGPTPKMDWAKLFAATQMDAAQFHTVAPLFIPTVAFDERVAYEGAVNGVPLHIDGAAFHGKLVSVSVTGAWNRTPSRLLVGLVGLFSSIWILVFYGVGSGFAIYFARRNVRMGSSDRTGARRVSVVVGIAAILELLFANHLPSAFAPPDFAYAAALGPYRVGYALYFAVVTGLSYVAAEPLTRRQSPHMLIGWARLLSGKWNDSLVGRDILVGTAGAAAAFLVSKIATALPWWIPIRSAVPESIPQGLTANGAALSGICFVFAFSIVNTMAALFVVALSRAFLRRRWVGYGLVAIFFGRQFISLLNPGAALAINVVAGLLIGALYVLILDRVGYLAFVVMFFLQGVAKIVSFDFRSGTWYFGYTLAACAIVAVIAGLGFRAALAGRPLMARDLLQENA